VTDAVTKPGKYLILKADLDKSHKKCKRLWLRLDAIKAADIHDDFVCFTLADELGQRPSTIS
jgi:hypothetical protein